MLELLPFLSPSLQPLDPGYQLLYYLATIGIFYCDFEIGSYGMKLVVIGRVGRD